MRGENKKKNPSVLNGILRMQLISRFYADLEVRAAGKQLWNRLVFLR